MARIVKVFQIVNTQAELIDHLDSEAQKLKSDLISKQVIGTYDWTTRGVD